VNGLSPYKGLTPFEDSELDVQFFFGREQEREIIAANLMASRLTVLYGDTGVGKSSVLRAGVAHHLRKVARRNYEAHGEPELAVVVFDAWRDDPLVALAEAVADAVRGALGGRQLQPPEEGTLVDQLQLWADVLGGDLYVILDQVEEYLLYHGADDGPGTFGAEFPETLDRTDLRINFLLSIREDALAKLDVFKGRVPNVLGNYLRLDHLDRRAARAAIVEPIAEYNRITQAQPVEIETDLVEAVLDEVAAGKVELGQSGRGSVEGAVDESRVETPFLQLVMQRLWEEERRAGSARLRLSTFRELGGAEQIVRDHLERALDALSAPEKDIAASMLDHLVTPSGTKIAHRTSDLAGYARVAESDLQPVLAKLEGERILRSVAEAANGGSSRHEIYHDVLASPVLGWKVAHEAQRELAKQKADADRRHRRLRRSVVAAVIAVVVMAGITIFAIAQRSEARAEARRARARELAATAANKLEIDPQKSLALAVQAANLQAFPQAEDVLRGALIAARERFILPSQGPVRTVSFSPDGSLVLTASADGTARLWRRDGVLVRAVRQPRALTGASFSPDGRLVLTSGEDGTARIWKADDGRPMAVLRSGGAVASAAFSRDGRLVVTASADATARIWNTATGALVRTFAHVGPVRSASLSGDGRVLVTVSSDRKGEHFRARLFTVRDGRLLRELPATGVTTVAFSPNGAFLATGSADHTAAIWKVKDGKRLYLFGGHQGGLTDILFGPHGRRVATTTSDSAARVWDVRSGTQVAFLLGHGNALNSASFSNDGTFLITASADDTARVWDLTALRIVAVLRGHTESVTAGAFSPDGHVAATASADGTARLWDPGIAPELRPLMTVHSPVETVSFSPDGRLIVAASRDGTARIVTRRGEVRHVFRHPGLASAIFTPDGRRVLTDGADKAIHVWSDASGRLIRVVPGVSSGPLALSRDGRLLAAPAADGSMQLWSAPALRPLRKLTAGSPFAAAGFSPDGRLVATGGEDDTVRVWNAARGTLLRVLRGHKDAVTDVEFSADGKLLVTSSRDHDARIWDVATGKSTVLRGHFGPVFGASFSPDGRWVVTAGPSTAGLWQVSTGQLLLYLRGHSEPLTSASFGPDSRSILTSSRDGTVRVYACEICGGLGELVALAKVRLAQLARPLTPAERKRYLSLGQS
jgi:WD40 repeat protein